MIHSVSVQSIEQVQEIVRESSVVFPRGAGTKPALSSPHLKDELSVAAIDLTGLTGILEYQPNEYTFTALAGTPVVEIEQALAEMGQYLPFEPPFSDSGATLGGTVASGLSGAGRYRYGGVRDFLIGLHFIEGHGDLVLGGGKVVKNAAGFDLPKLMVGSMGRLGIIVDLSFKVFPAPKAYRTLKLDYSNLDSALNGMSKLAVAPLDLDAVELIPQPNSTVQMILRVGGAENVLFARLGRLEDLLMDGTIVDLEEEGSLWRGLSNFDWIPTNAALVKIPTSPRQLRILDAYFDSDTKRIYSVGGHLCWLAWDDSLARLDQILTEQALSGLILSRGKESSISNDKAHIQGPLLGRHNNGTFGHRIQQGLDPQGKFLRLAGQ